MGIPIGRQTPSQGRVSLALKGRVWQARAGPRPGRAERPDRAGRAGPNRGLGARFAKAKLVRACFTWVFFWAAPSRECSKGWGSRPPPLTTLGVVPECSPPTPEVLGASQPPTLRTVLSLCAKNPGVGGERTGTTPSVVMGGGLDPHPLEHSRAKTTARTSVDANGGWLCVGPAQPRATRHASTPRSVLVREWGGWRCVGPAPPGCF